MAGDIEGERKKWLDKIEKMRKILEGKKSEGVDTSEVEGVLKAAEEALEKGDTKEFASKIKEATSRIKGLQKGPKRALRAKVPSKKVEKMEVVQALKRVKGLLDAAVAGEEVIEKAREEFSKGQAFFREGKFPGALAALERAEAILKETAVEKEAPEEAPPKEVSPEEEKKEIGEEERAIEEFFKGVESIRNLGGDLSPIEEHIKYVEGAKAAGDIKAAAETARSLMEWVNQYIDTLEKKKVEKPKKKEPERKKKEVEKEELKAGEAEVEKVEEAEKEEVKEAPPSEGVPEEIETFFSKIKEIEGLGGDLSPIKDHIKYVNGALSSGDTSSALEVVRSLTEWVETYLSTLKKEEGEEVKEKAEEEVPEKREEAPAEAAPEKEEEEGVKGEELTAEIEEFFSKLNKLVELGGDTSSIKEHIEYIKTSQESGNLKAAAETARSLKEWLDNYMTTIYEQKIEELKRDVEEAIGKLSSLPEVKIEEIKKRWEGVKDVGANEEGVKELTAFSEIIKGELKKALAEARKRLEEVLKGVETEERWLKERGAKVDEVKETLAEAWKSLEEGNFSAAEEVINGYVNRIREWFKKSVEREVEENIKAVEEGISTLEGMGVNVEAYQKEIEDLKGRIEENPIEAVEGLGELRRRIEEEKEKVEVGRQEALKSEIEGFKAKMDALKSEGVNVAPMERIYSLTAQAVDAGDFAKAEQLLQKLRTAYTNLVKLSYKDKIEGFKSEVEELLRYFSEKDVDVDTSSVELALKNVLRAYEEGAVDDLPSLLAEGRRRLDGLKTEGYNLLYQKRMIPLLNTIRRLKEAGIDLSAIDGKVGEVKELFNSGKYTEWEERLEEVEKTVFAYDANDTLRKLREVILRLSEVGHPSAPELGKVYNDALSRYNQGDYVGSLELSKKAFEEALKAEKEASYTSLINELNGVLDKARSLSLDVSNFEEKLRNAQELWTSGEGERAKELLKETIEAASEAVRRAEALKQQKEALTAELDRLWRKIHELSERGFSTAEVSRRAENIKEAIERGMLEDATRMMDDLKKEIESIERGGTTAGFASPTPTVRSESMKAQELSIIISQIKEKISLMKERGMNTSRYQADLLKMLQTFKEGEYDQAIELGRECLGKIEGELKGV